MNGYNFTERVRKVLAFAREEAAGLRHEYVGTEHILLALIREGAGVADTVLENLGVDQPALRERVLSIVQPGRSDPERPDLPYTSRAKKVLELAMSEARGLNHSYVGTEHLLLGLVAEKKGIGAQVLAEAGVSLEKARDEAVRVLGTEMPQTHASSAHAALAKPTFAATTPVLPLTDRGRRVLAQAGDLASERGSAIITAAHVAIAIIEHEDGAANAVLDNFGVEPDALLAGLEPLAADTADAANPDTMVMLDRRLADRIAALQADRGAPLGPPSGTGDLLVAALESSPEVDHVFATNGVTPQQVREELRRISG